MGRKKKNVVYRYVELLEDKRSKCLVRDCGKILHTQHGANLVNHMKTLHKEQYEEIVTLNKSLSETKNDKNTQSDVSSQVVKECQELVTVHGLPFQAMNYRAFQNILSMIPNNTATVSAQTVRDNVQVVAAKIREELSRELQEKMISLKADIASLATRSFFGINVQYIKDNKIILRNLAVIEIFERHTAEHLKDILTFTLLRFRIEKRQIYCVTTDNGANMLKMGRILSEEAANSSSPAELQESGSSTEQSSSTYNIIDNSDEEDENNSLDSIDDLAQEELSTRVLSSLRAHFDEVPDELNFKTGVVRCAAHTLQLAMQNACRECELTTMLHSAREIVKRLRSQIFAMDLHRRKLNIPKLDCNTRWHSTLDMIESLLPLKDFCALEERLHLPESTWEQLHDFVKSMTPGKILTKSLQKEQLTVGEFYLAWITCQFQLREINTTLSVMVHDKMTERQAMLFENELFITGIFLDPRVNSVLSTEQRNLARDNLIKIYNRIKELSAQNQENRDLVFEELSQANTSSASGSNPEQTSAQSSLVEFLNTSYINAHDDINTLIRSNDFRAEFADSLNISINRFFEEPLVEHSVKILNWWKSKQDQYPLLYKLACIVLAVPMTQVSVERLFSSLKFVVSNRRLSLKADVIEDILLIRSNRLFDKNTN